MSMRTTRDKNDMHARQVSSEKGLSHEADVLFLLRRPKDECFKHDDVVALHSIARSAFCLT